MNENYQHEFEMVVREMLSRRSKEIALIFNHSAEERVLHDRVYELLGKLNNSREEGN